MTDIRDKNMELFFGAEHIWTQQVRSCQNDTIKEILYEQIIRGEIENVKNEIKKLEEKLELLENAR